MRYSCLNFRNTKLENTSTVSEVKETSTSNETPQQIEITEEQLAQLLNGENGLNIPQMLVDPAILSFYTRLQNREIVINDVIDECLVEYYQYILDWVNEDNLNEIPIEERTPIKIFINTDGGDVNSILFFIGLLSTVKQKIITIGMGKCYSAGCLLLLSGQKGNRYIFPYTSVLLHDGSTIFGNSMAKTIDEAKDIIKLTKKIKKLVLDHTNLSSKKYDEKYRVEWYLDAEKAIKHGFADKIITDINEIL